LEDQITIGASRESPTTNRRGRHLLPPDRIGRKAVCFATPKDAPDESACKLRDAFSGS
jgi:hypothetical protein